MSDNLLRPWQGPVLHRALLGWQNQTWHKHWLSWQQPGHPIETPLASMQFDLAFGRDVFFSFSIGGPLVSMLSFTVSEVS